MKFNYTCRYCGEARTITFWKWLFTRHFGSRRLLQCEHCGAKRHYMKKRKLADEEKVYFGRYEIIYALIHKEHWSVAHVMEFLNALEGAKDVIIKEDNIGE